MKKLLIGLVALIVILLGAILILPGLVPDQVYKDRIEAELQKALGREVSLGGDVKVAALPQIKASVSDVTLSNPEGFDGPALAVMPELRAKIALWPLLRKEVQIKEFVLVDPVITLTKLTDGRMNWAVESAGLDSAQQGETASEGFARDGAMADLDISLGDVRLINAAIRYNDQAATQSYEARNVNMALSLPAMDQALTLKGDLVFQDKAFALDAMLDTPRAFLSGNAAPFSADIDSGLGSINAKGEFLASRDITFTADLGGNIPAIDQIQSLIGMDIPYSNLAQSADFKGRFAFDGDVISGTDTDIAIKGALIDASYKGGFSTAQTAQYDGSFDVTVKDAPRLITALELDIAGTELITSATAKGSVKGTGAKVEISGLDATAKGPALNGGYKGGVSIGEAIALNGTYDATITDLAPILTAFEQDIPAARAVQAITAEGAINGPVDALTLSSLIATVTGEGLDADFKGDLTLAGEGTLKGTFTADVASLEQLAKTANIDVPYVNVAGGMTANGSVDGPLSAISLSALNAALTDGLLSASIENGAATIGESIALSGDLAIGSTDVRALASATGTPLPEGSGIFKTFAASGAVSGTVEDLTFNNARLEFDDIVGNGAFGVSMRGDKPALSGTLDIPGGLDLAPYMAKSTATSQSKTGGIPPWSESPLDLAPLRSVDADMTVTTATIKTDRLTLGQSTVAVTLKNGRLEAKIPNTTLYGGTGTLTAILDGSGATAQAGLDMTIDSVSAPQFLGAAAGFDKVTGLTSTTLSLRGSGSTQKALMQSLTGDGKFGVSDGALKGVNVPELVTGLEQAFTSRTLPGGIGPSQSTTFSNLLGSFKMENGVVVINDFDLKGLGVRARGNGRLDIGGQQIDFSLRPQILNASGQPVSNDLLGLGVPIKFSGPFNAVRPSLDTEVIGQIVEARARAEASRAITDRVGGPLGDILGGALGGQTPQTPAPSQPTPEGETPEDKTPEEKAPEEKAPEEKASEEKASELSPEEEALKALGGLFGNKN